MSVRVNPSLSPSPGCRKEKRECYNSDLGHFPLALDPLSPKQLCKDYQPNKNKVEYKKSEMIFKKA